MEKEIKVYSVRMKDSETKGPESVFPGILAAQPLNQDDDSCYYRVSVEIAQAQAMEAALDADADVISYGTHA